MQLIHFMKTLSSRELFIVPFFLVLIHLSSPLLAEWSECGRSKNHTIYRRMTSPMAPEDRFEFAVTRPTKSSVPNGAQDHIGDNEIVATMSLIDTLRQRNTHGTPMSFELFEVQSMGDHSNGAIQSLLSVYARLHYGSEEPGTQIGFLFKEPYSAMGSFLGTDPASPLRPMGFTVWKPLPAGHIYPTITGANKTVGKPSDVVIAALREEILEHTKEDFLSVVVQ